MFIIKELRRLLFQLLDFQLGTQPNSLKQKENVSQIFPAVKFNMFDLQLNECVHSETCLDEGFSQHMHIPYTYIYTYLYIYPLM